MFVDEGMAQEMQFVRCTWLYFPVLAHHVCVSYGPTYGPTPKHKEVKPRNASFTAWSISIPMHLDVQNLSGIPVHQLINHAFW